jgi:hypothetical protein
MIPFTKEYGQIGVYAPAWQNCPTLVDTGEKEVTLGRVFVKNDLPAGTELFADPLVVKVFLQPDGQCGAIRGKITTIRFFIEGRDGDQIIVCEDDGEGVPVDEKVNIFERGFGKNPRLGLFISREILDITGITIREPGCRIKENGLRWRYRREHVDYNSPAAHPLTPFLFHSFSN